MQDIDQMSENELVDEINRLEVVLDLLEGVKFMDEEEEWQRWVYYEICRAIASEKYEEALFLCDALEDVINKAEKVRH